MSEHKQLKSAQGIVTSDAIHGKRRISKKTMLIGSGIAILVIAGILLVTLMPKTKPMTAQNQSTTATLTAKQALVKAQNELKTASTSQQKANAYLDLGTAYLNDNQASQAIAAYQNSSSVSGSNNANQVSLSIGLGWAYSQDGQTSKAIDSFNQVISLLQQSNDPYAQGKVSTYQLLVQRLQDGEPI